MVSNGEVATFDFTIVQGANFDYTLTYYNSDGTTKDWTGYTATLTIKDSVGGATTIDTLTSTAGDITLGSSGTIDIVINAATTAGYSFSTASYDLTLTDSSGVVTRLLKGNMSLDLSV